MQTNKKKDEGNGEVIGNVGVSGHDTSKNAALLSE